MPPWQRNQHRDLLTVSPVGFAIKAQQVAFFIPEHATLVSGDVLAGRDGRIRIFLDEADPELLLPSLEALSDLPIERVIIPHGDLILSGGAARIRATVAEARRA